MMQPQSMRGCPDLRTRFSLGMPWTTLVMTEVQSAEG